MLKEGRRKESGSKRFSIQEHYTLVTIYFSLTDLKNFHDLVATKGKLSTLKVNMDWFENVII